MTTPTLTKIAIPPNSGRPHQRNVMPGGVAHPVGPFIFFDHLGPFTFPARRPVYVPPHPHTGIATISYLFDGEGMHKDSLGHAQVLHRGRLNWMNAGSGIVHSEGTSAAYAARGGRLSGLQLWILGSDRERAQPATFQTYAQEQLPAVHTEHISAHVLAGTYAGHRAPTETDRDMVLLAATATGADTLVFPLSAGWEYLVYCLEGGLTAEGEALQLGEGLILHSASSATTAKVTTQPDSRLIFLGGPPLGHPPVFNGSLVAGSSQEMNAYVQKLDTEGFGHLAYDPSNA